MISFWEDKGMYGMAEVGAAVEAWHPIMVHWITSIKGNNRAGQSLSEYKSCCFHLINHTIIVAKYWAKLFLTKQKSIF